MRTISVGLVNKFGQKGVGTKAEIFSEIGETANYTDVILHRRRTCRDSVGVPENLIDTLLMKKRIDNAALKLTEPRFFVPFGHSE